MQKVTPESLTADWSVIGNRAPWKHVTSAELARVLGKHLQTINNWKIRGILPMPSEKSRSLRGNKNYFKISTIRAWLESRPEDDIIREWARREMRDNNVTDGQISWFIGTLYKVVWEFSS